MFGEQIFAQLRTGFKPTVLQQFVSLNRALTQILVLQQFASLNRALTQILVRTVKNN